jgi:NAD(P)H-hydrate repair Nnr-like enzyme with NAD(P)H-hydrate dehydratase domain
MGDVLTGIIAGLAAQGSGLSAAARGGVWLHGAAADVAAAEGETGMMASDLFTPLRGLIHQQQR